MNYAPISIKADSRTLNGPDTELANRAGQQMSLALETGQLPEEKNDLFKMAATGQLLKEIEGARDAFIVEANAVLEEVTSARIGSDEIAEADAEAKAVIGDIKAEGAAACKAARIAYEQAAAQRKFYENAHVPRPEWARYYDRLPNIFLFAAGGESLISGGIIVATAEIKGGIEVVLPFLVFTTIVNLKLAGYIGRLALRWRAASRLVKVRLGCTVGAGSIWLLAQNAFLGFWRTGLDFSISSVIKLAETFGEHLGSITISGLGMALAIAVAHQSSLQIHRGFTPVYRQLRDEEARLFAAWHATRAFWRAQLDEAYEAGAADITAGLDAARAAHDDVLNARRRLIAARLRLRHKIRTRAREISFYVAEYNQRVTAAWPRLDEVPDHYRRPVDMMAGIGPTPDRELAVMAAVRHQVCTQSSRLASVELLGLTAKAALGQDRNRIATMIREA